MEERERSLLWDLLETPTPSGYETRGQRRWLDYVSESADRVFTDDYGNAIAVLDGGGPDVLLAGHGDEIGFIVRRIDEEGFVYLGCIGGSDRSVTRGQQVTIHAADGEVPGVVGQTAVHLREQPDEYTDVEAQPVDIGVDDREAAAELVEVGDPVTFAATVQSLQGTRLAARGVDNRVGAWAAAVALDRAAEAGVDATLYAASSVQEEVGLNGAQMLGHRLDPDAAIAIDVTHAGDHPEAPAERTADISLGEGPVVARGGPNHERLVRAVRDAADSADVPIQLAATGTRTGTDADAYSVQQGGIPSMYLGVPNRYMHTPVEVVDTTDLDDLAELLARFARDAAEHAPFTLDV